MVFCSGSNIWDNRMSFCSVLLESTVIKFWLVNREIKVISGKSRFVEAESLTPRWTHCCFVFLLFVLTVKCILFFCEWKVLLFGRRRTIGFIQDKHYDLVLHSKCKNACVLFILTMICFAFWWQEWQVLDSVSVLGHFQHRDWLFGNAS